MNKIFVFVLCTSIVPMVASGNALDDRISALIAEKQDILAQLEECQKSNKGFKIAGLATLGVSAIGIGVNIGEAVKIKDYDRQIEAANNTCGSAVCSKTLGDDLNAETTVCINGQVKVAKCKEKFKPVGDAQKCKRKGKDITYYEKCEKTGTATPAHASKVSPYTNMLDEFVVTAPARPDECKNKAVHLSEAHRRPRIKGFFQVDVESGSVIRHGNGEWLPTLEDFGGELVLKPVYVCPDGQYLNVSNLRFGTTQANGYNKELHTNIAISSGVKCSNSCDTYSFEYDVDRAVGLHEEDVVFTKQACLIGDKGFNVLLDACLQYCKKNKEAKDGVINQKECKITGVAIDVEAHNCLCNPTGVKQYRYYKYNNGEEL